MDNDIKYMYARARMREIKSFYNHVALFVIGNIFFIVINLVLTPRTLWFYWPFFAWGVGIVMNAILVFGFRSYFGRRWEEKKINDILHAEFE